jgi:SRSO17 transposase
VRDLGKGRLVILGYVSLGCARGRWSVEVMTPHALTALDTRVERFVRDLTEPMGRRERRHWAQVSVHGVVRDGNRPSIAPMASRLPEADAPALRPCVGPSPWAVDAVPRRWARQVVDRLSEPDVWIIDATALPNAGTPAVGVARPYGGPRGQVANGQVAVSWHWRGAEASCPLNGRLYGPKAWLDEQQRAAHVRVPPGMPSRRHTALAVDLIDQARAWEVPALPLVADALYGNDGRFR